jgi:hypothetical protein
VLAIVAGCGLGGPATADLELDGVRARVPAGAVDLEPDGVDRLRQLASRDVPEQTVDLRAVRDPQGLARIWLHRNVEADASRYGSTVGAALDAVGADLRDQLARDGAEILRVDPASRDGGAESCFTGRLQGAPLGLCVLATVDAERDLVLDGVGCVGPDELCAPVLASRAWPAEGALPPETEFPPPPKPAGLPGVGGTEVWGLAMGSSRDRFRATCRGSGHEVDRFDWELEPPEVRDWFDRGEVARCTGLPMPPPPELGPVVGVDAAFRDDRLVSATVYLASPLPAVESALVGAYPQGIEGSGQVLHLIDPGADGDGLMGVVVGPAIAPGAQSRLTFVSRRGAP